MSQFPEFDLYAALHLSHDATMQDVRAHYTQIMRGNHVDHPEFLARIRQQFPAQPDEADTAYRERIADIAKRSVQRFNVAYEILSDPIQRKAYDRHMAISTESQDPPKQAQAHCQHMAPETPPLKSSKRRFFNRQSGAEHRPRRTWTESDSGQDKYCIWKQ